MLHRLAPLDVFAVGPAQVSLDGVVLEVDGGGFGVTSVVVSGLLVLGAGRRREGGDGEPRQRGDGSLTGSRKVLFSLPSVAAVCSGGPSGSAVWLPASPGKSAPPPGAARTPGIRRRTRLLRRRAGCTSCRAPPPARARPCSGAG